MPITRLQEWKQRAPSFLLLLFIRNSHFSNIGILRCLFSLLEIRIDHGSPVCGSAHSSWAASGCFHEEEFHSYSQWLLCTQSVTYKLLFSTILLFFLCAFLLLHKLLLSIHFIFLLNYFPSLIIMHLFCMYTHRGMCAYVFSCVYVVYMCVHIHVLGKASVPP